MEDLRLCMKCRFVKEAGDFYPYQPRECKECVRARVKKNRRINHAYYIQFDRARAKLPHRVAQNIAITSRWRKSNPERWSAHKAVGYAIKKGELKPLPCLICGEKAEAHHPDYSRPLDVVWLCPQHHKSAHALVSECCS